MNSFVFQYLKLPKKEDVNINFRSYWNTGVFYTFDFIANVPSKIVSLKDYVADFASSPPADGKQEEQAGNAEESKTVPEAVTSPPTPEAPAAQEKTTEET